MSSAPVVSKSLCSECRKECEIKRYTYCANCWDSWFNSHAAKHYDFIEIGTCDWNTLTEFCHGDEEHGAWLAREIRTSLDDLRQCRGLAVDAVDEYLQALPDLDRVQKVVASMDETSGDKKKLYFVSPAQIQQHMGQYFAPVPIDPNCAHWEERPEVDVMWYAKSMSSIGQRQPQLVKMLEEVNRPDLLEEREVCTWSWTDLCETYGVASVDVVQIDCEGKDCAILRGLLAYCADRPQAFPRVIKFECNHLSSHAEADEVLDKLRRHGYVVRSKTGNDVVVERMPTTEFRAGGCWDMFVKVRKLVFGDKCN